MSAFIGASIPRSSLLSFGSTLLLSRAFERFSTVAFHSPSVIFMPLCAVFMSRPTYEHGPPVASQIWSARFDFSFSTSAGFMSLNRALTRLSPAKPLVECRRRIAHRRAGRQVQRGDAQHDPESDPTKETHRARSSQESQRLRRL